MGDQPGLSRRQMIKASAVAGAAAWTAPVIIDSLAESRRCVECRSASPGTPNLSYGIIIYKHRRATYYAVKVAGEYVLPRERAPAATGRGTSTSRAATSPSRTRVATTVVNGTTTLWVCAYSPRTAPRAPTSS